MIQNFSMISHGIISGSLFFCIGMLYDRYHTRLLYYYGGLVQFMPIYSTFFFILAENQFVWTILSLTLYQYTKPSVVSCSVIPDAAFSPVLPPPNCFSPI